MTTTSPWLLPWHDHLPLPTVLLLTENQRLNRWVKAGRVRALRAHGHALTHNHLIRREWTALDQARIVITLGWHDHGRRRDPNNWAPTGKAIVDGMVDAGLLPDDSTRHLIGPDMRAAHPDQPRPTPGTTFVTITIRPWRDDTP